MDYHTSAFNNRYSFLSVLMCYVVNQSALLCIFYKVGFDMFCHCTLVFLTCVAIDNCVGRPHSCDANATCISYSGRVSCTWNEGFTGNGVERLRVQYLLRVSAFLTLCTLPLSMMWNSLSHCEEQICHTTIALSLLFKSRWLDVTYHQCLDLYLLMLASSGQNFKTRTSL